MEAKIKIKTNHFEVEFEGREEFLKEDLLNIMESILEKYSSTGVRDEIKPATNSQLIDNPNVEVGLTTSTIASKLKVNSGPELILAAMTHFHFVQKKNTASRKEIFEEMKSATAFYKSTFGGNLTLYITNLIKSGKVLETSKDTYALSNAWRSQVLNLLQVE